MNQALSGYSAPLFDQHKPRWTDDRMLGGSLEKAESRYHDKENTLKILNGLCSDLFFRSEDVHQPWFQDIPDCALPVANLEIPKRPVDYRKPLDSGFKKRTYVIGKELPTSLPNKKIGDRRQRFRGRKRGRR